MPPSGAAEGFPVSGSNFQALEWPDAPRPTAQAQTRTSACGLDVLDQDPSAGSSVDQGRREAEDGDADFGVRIIEELEERGLV